jgi:peptidyl-tRNA hydrolase
MPAEDYVLSKFKRNELSSIKKAVEKSAEAALIIISEGISRAQNVFHSD